MWVPIFTNCLSPKHHSDFTQEVLVQYDVPQKWRVYIIAPIVPDFTMRRPCIVTMYWWVSSGEEIPSFKLTYLLTV